MPAGHEAVGWRGFNAGEWGLAPSPDPKWMFVAVPPDASPLVSFGRSDGRPTKGSAKSPKSGAYWEKHLLRGKGGGDMIPAIRKLEKKDGLYIITGNMAFDSDGSVSFISCAGHRPALSKSKRKGRSRSRSRSRK